MPVIKGGKIVREIEPSPAVAQTMVKKVNIIARIPVRTLTPPVYGSYEGVTMSAANICKCLVCKAIVEEILPDGSCINLNLQNYNKVHKLEDPEVQRQVMENRKSAVLGTRAQAYMTMDNIKNHTAPLPRSHYLYNTQTVCDSEEFADPHEAVKQDTKDVLESAAVSVEPPERTLPVVDTGSKEVHGDTSPVGEELSEDD